MLPCTARVAPLALLLVLQSGTSGQTSEAEVCTWCLNEPERLAGSRAIGHGPFEIARTTSAALAEEFNDREWLFLETAHFRIAWNLPMSRVSRKDAKLLEPDIARLRAVLVDVPEKISKLPPGLRLHLMGQLLEDTYDRFQEIAAITDADFLPRDEPDPPALGRVLDGVVDEVDEGLVNQPAIDLHLRGEGGGLELERDPLLLDSVAKGLGDLVHQGAGVGGGGLGRRGVLEAGQLDQVRDHVVHAPCVAQDPPDRVAHTVSRPDGVILQGLREPQDGCQG